MGPKEGNFADLKCSLGRLLHMWPRTPTCHIRDRLSRLHMGPQTRRCRIRCGGLLRNHRRLWTSRLNEFFGNSHFIRYSCSLPPVVAPPLLITSAHHSLVLSPRILLL
ncbi:hypothetical protein ACTXT7_017080 [Hymenolepis weldensis]